MHGGQIAEERTPAFLVRGLLFGLWLLLYGAHLHEVRDGVSQRD